MTDSELQKNPLPTGSDEGEEEDKSYADNYAMAIALGLPFGLVFGLLVLDDMIWGLLIGTGLAPIIAMVMTKVKSDD